MLRERLPELLRGSDDEDVHRIFGLRLPAFGLTHTYVPESSRGELWFPSARTMLSRFCKQAAAHDADENRAGWYLGRAAHLYCDVAVPARAQRVWHFAADPLEAYVDQHIDELVGTCDRMSAPSTPEALLCELAGFARTLKADTTRTPWGRARYRWNRHGHVVSEAEARTQAEALLPLLVAHLARALVEAAPKRRSR